MKTTIALLCIALLGLVYIGCSDEIPTQVQDEETLAYTQEMPGESDLLSASKAPTKCDPWPSCKGDSDPTRNVRYDVTSTGAIAFDEYSFGPYKDNGQALALQADRAGADVTAISGFATAFSNTLVALRTYSGGAEVTAAGIDAAVAAGFCEVNWSKGAPVEASWVAELVELGLNAPVGPTVEFVSVYYDRRSEVSGDHLVNAQFLGTVDVDGQGEGSIVVGIREAPSLFPEAGVPTAIKVGDEPGPYTLTYSGGAVLVWSRRASVKDNYGIACENLDGVQVTLVRSN